MKEIATLEDKLMPLVDKALSAMESTGEFVIEQTPLLLQEFYAWHISKSIFLGLMFLVASILCIVVFVKSIKWDKALNAEEDNPIYWITGTFSGMGGIVFIVVFFNRVYDLIMILVAPRLYLIEYFMELKNGQ